MSRLLNAYANMLEALAQMPERLPGPPPAPNEAKRRVKVIALLRALTPEEGKALLQEKQIPERLDALADEVGLPAEECRRVLVGTVWKLTEGLRPRPDPDRREN